MYKMTGYFRIKVEPIIADDYLVGHTETLQQEMQCQSYGNIIWVDIPYVDADGKEIEGYVKRVPGNAL